MHDKWFERHWMIGGNQGSAYVDGFEPEGKIVRTTHLLQNVSGQRTITAAGPTRSFGSLPAEGTIVTEPLPTVTTCHEDYFENYKKAYRGEARISGQGRGDPPPARTVWKRSESPHAPASRSHSNKKRDTERAFFSGSETICSAEKGRLRLFPCFEGKREKDE